MNFDAQKSVLGVLEQKKGENFPSFFFFFREKAESRGAVEKLSPDEAHTRGPFPLKRTLFCAER